MNASFSFLSRCNQRLAISFLSGILSLSFCFVFIPVNSVNADLVGHWTFDNQDLDESSGFRADGVHDGVANGTVSFTNTNLHPCFNGTGFALDLTAAGSSVLVQNSNWQDGGSGGSGGAGSNPTYMDTFDNHLLNSGGMTISFWAQGTPNRWAPFVSKKGEQQHGYQVRRHNTSQNPTFTMRQTAGADDPQATGFTFDGDWHHYAAVWNGTAETRELWVDGQLIHTESDAGDASWGSPTFEYLVFGGRDSGGSITDSGAMYLDEIRIYDEALDQSSIENLAHVPEPTSIAFLSLVGFGLFARRSRHSS